MSCRRRRRELSAHKVSSPGLRVKQALKRARSITSSTLLYKCSV